MQTIPRWSLFPVMMPCEHTKRGKKFAVSTDEIAPAVRVVATCRTSDCLTRQDLDAVEGVDGQDAIL